MTPPAANGRLMAGLTASEQILARIRAIRKKKGLRLRQMAECMGTTETTLSRLTSGTQNLTIDWLEKISEALGVGFADLVPPTHEPTRDWRPLVQQIADVKLLAMLIEQLANRRALEPHEAAALQQAASKMVAGALDLERDVLALAK